MQKQSQEKTPAELLDLLPAPGGNEDFNEVVASLQLSEELVGKIRAQQARQALNTPGDRAVLEPQEENELATEALILRHQFTEQICRSIHFRQAAITVISNIYLFANRRIFFEPGKTTEQERQQALLMLTSERPHVPLAKSFQHHILARIWNRICTLHSQRPAEKDFQEFTEIINKINAIRNIYITLSIGFIHKMARRTPPLYMQNISREDAVQIASFGVARAAYRYHPTLGVRFSTFSARWIQKEIQRQALQGRLIRISPYAVNKSVDRIALTSPLLFAEEEDIEQKSDGTKVEEEYERKELRQLIDRFLETRLTPKCADILRRRYGLAPYSGKSQSIISIANHYRVSRSSIYQLEQSSIKKLRKHVTALAADKKTAILPGAPDKD